MPTNKQSLVDTSTKAVNDEDNSNELGVVLPPTSSPSINASNLHSILSDELEQESDKHSDLDSKLIAASAGDDDAHEMPVKKVNTRLLSILVSLSLSNRVVTHTLSFSNHRGAPKFPPRTTILLQLNNCLRMEQCLLDTIKLLDTHLLLLIMQVQSSLARVLRFSPTIVVTSLGWVVTMNHK